MSFAQTQTEGLFGDEVRTALQDEMMKNFEQITDEKAKAECAAEILSVFLQQKKYREALETLRWIPNEKEKMAFYSEIIRIQIRNNEEAAALEFLDEIPLDFGSRSFFLGITLGLVDEENWMPTLAKKLLEKIEEVPQEEDSETDARILECLAKTYLYFRLENREAFDVQYRKTWEVIQKCGDYQGVITYGYNLSVVAILAGDLERGIQTLRDVEDGKKKCSGETTGFFSMAEEDIIVDAFIASGQYEKAREYAGAADQKNVRESESSFEYKMNSFTDEPAFESRTENEADSCLQKAEKEISEKEFEKTLKKRELTQAEKWISRMGADRQKYAWKDLGNAFLQDGKPAEAERCMRNIEVGEVRTQLCENLIWMFVRKKNTEEAIRIIENFRSPAMRFRLLTGKTGASFGMYGAQLIFLDFLSVSNEFQGVCDALYERAMRIPPEERFGNSMKTFFFVSDLVPEGFFESSRFVTFWQTAAMMNLQLALNHRDEAEKTMGSLEEAFPEIIETLKKDAEIQSKEETETETETESETEIVTESETETVSEGESECVFDDLEEKNPAKMELEALQLVMNSFRARLAFLQEDVPGAMKLAEALPEWKCRLLKRYMLLKIIKKQGTEPALAVLRGIPEPETRAVILAEMLQCDTRYMEENDPWDFEVRFMLYPWKLNLFF